MEVATPEPCTSKMKKINRVHKQQQQHPQNTQESPETTERKYFTDLESLHSDDSEDLQETPRNTPTTPRDKTTLTDHKSIDILCDTSREQGNHPISINTFSHFLKNCRRQKDPKIIAKDYTTNSAGLVSMLEDNMSRTKDYNLRRRMKRIVDRLKQ
jgi:hypothetical protein